MKPPRSTTAFPMTSNYYAECGLSKLEYAAIHICAGLSANPHYAKEESALRIAEISVNQAKELFRILESEQ